MNQGQSQVTGIVVRSLLRRSKDATAAFAARQAINSKLRGIGEITRLSIDSKNKRIQLLVELVGELEPFEIEIGRYRLNHAGSGPGLTIEKATASRPWLTAILREFVVGQTFPVPAKAAPFLKLLG